MKDRKCVTDRHEVRGKSKSEDPEGVKKEEAAIALDRVQWVRACSGQDKRPNPKELSGLVGDAGLDGFHA